MHLVQDQVSRGPWRAMVNWAQTEVAATLAKLPKPLRETAARVPVTYQRVPSSDLIKEGIEPDTLGLFVGPNFPEESIASGGVPAQIILFLDNIWEMTRGQETAFREEACTTYLHELGHYLGLDEKDLWDRGLD